MAYIGRRGLLAAATAAALVPRPARAGSFNGPVFSSEGMLGTFGINTHFTYCVDPVRYPNWTVAKFPQINTALWQLGVKHIRDGVAYNWDYPTTQVGNNYSWLYRQFGIRINVGCNVYPGTCDATGDLQYARAMELRDPGIIASLEGANEVDPRVIDPSVARAFQAKFYQMCKADPVLRHIPVLPCTIWGDASKVYALGNLNGLADIGNVHSYANSDAYWNGGIACIPWPQIDAMLTAHANVTPGMPLYTTEFGNSRSLGSWATAPIPLRPALLCCGWLDAVIRGYQRAFLYELFSESFDDFGIYDANGNAFSEATALRQLIGCFVETGTTATVTTPPCTVQGSAFSIGIATPDGSHKVVVWNEWGDQPVSIICDTGHASISVYNPCTSTLQVVTNTSRVDVIAGMQPLVIKMSAY